VPPVEIRPDAGRAAATRAAGLRLTATDLEALAPAWKRYLALVEELRAALAPEPWND